MNNLRIYKCGDIYKYVSFPLTCNIDFDKRGESFQNDSNIKKLNNNIIRAKTKVKDLILCNSFFYFITITINNNYNRSDLHKIEKLVNHRIRNLRLHNKELDLFYLFIPEQHKKGGWHLHGVISKDFNKFIHLNKNGYEDLTCFNSLGFNSISEIEDLTKVSFYITKYITKDFVKRDKGEHLYFCSRGLQRPQLVNDIVYNNQYFNERFFDFRTDFCYVKYSYKNYEFITNLLSA